MKRTHIGAMGLAALLTVAGPVAAQEQPRQPAPSDKPKVLITISKETTYITEPLRKDGYVDYVAAINQLASEGVTPENNAAVPFLKAVGPSTISKEMRERYFKMLGIAPLPEKGDYYVTLFRFARGLKPAEKPAIRPNEREFDVLCDQLFRAMERPWLKKDFPVVAGWLAANDKPLALLVEASNRPRRYGPLVSSDGYLLSASSSALTEDREAARALSARAMLCVGEGRLEEAWWDLLACHRLAHGVGQKRGTFDLLLVASVDGIACAADHGLLQHAQVTTIQSLKMRDDLAELLPLANAADTIDPVERFTFLDSVRYVACNGFSIMRIVHLDSGPPSELWSSLDSARAAVDWNQVLRMGNSWYDRLGDAYRKPGRAERQAAIRQIGDDLQKLAAEAKDQKSLATSVAAGSRKEISRQAGQALVWFFVSAFSACAQAEDRATMQFELTKLGFALAAYRADHGSFPTKLADLVPKYAGEIPKDLFNDAELHYKPEGGGCLLYSVGPNGRDDGGKTVNDCKAGEGWDDVSVRVGK